MRGLASRAVSYFGRFGGTLSIFSLLSQSNIDWNEKAGPRYDNSAVMAIIQYLQGGIESGPRLIVEKPVRGSRGREWLEIDNHPLPMAVTDGRLMTDSQLNAGAILSLVVRGDAYWVKDRSASGKLLGYIYFAHWLVAPKNDRDFGGRKAGEHLVTYYEVRCGDGSILPLAPEDVVHFRWGIDPANPARGISPLWAALREIVSDNEAVTLMAAMLANGGVLGWAISPDKIGDEAPDVDMPKMREVGRHLQTYVRGDNAGTPAPLPFPIKVTQLGHEPSKLVLDKQRQMAIERILSQYGIDPMVLGLPSQSKTFSNYEEANEAAVRRALLRVLGIMGSSLTKQSLRVDFPATTQNFSQSRVGWDLSEVPALQPDVDAQHARGREDFKYNLITRAEWREENGYKVDSARDDVFSADVAAPKVDPNADPNAKQLSKMTGPERVKLARLAAAKEGALADVEALDA